jgi:hypothetical protein
MHIAAADRVKNALIPAIKSVHDAIAAKAKEFKDVVKIGRTHLQDAVPLTVGQEFGGWASLLERDIHRLEQALEGLYEDLLGDILCIVEASQPGQGDPEDGILVPLDDGRKALRPASQGEPVQLTIVLALVLVHRFVSYRLTECSAHPVRGSVELREFPLRASPLGQGWKERRG